MPFVRVNIKEEIEELRRTDPEFREAWDNSRMEYEILGQLTKLRNQKGLTQTELAKKAGKQQYLISQIEKHEKSPTLATLCHLANALDADIKIIPR